MVHPSLVYLLTSDYSYPEANGYGEVERVLPSVGGEAVNTAIMLSKLGIRTKLDGTWIIKDKESQINHLLAPFDIDTTRLRTTELNGASEILIADGQNRTCFGNFDTYKKDGKKWNSPNIEDIKNASIVALDPFFDDDTYFVANTCMDFNIPYVTLDSDYDDILGQQAEVLIISQDHRDWNYPRVNPEELFIKYTENCKGLIIFTFGSSDMWYARSGEIRKSKQPFKIDPVDTTAAGDTYRAGIIYGLLNNMPDDEMITFANAVSACVCLSVPHALNATDLEGVLKFIYNHNV